MHLLYRMYRVRGWTLPKSRSLVKCRNFPLAVLPLFALLCGCGGGSVSQQPPPVPPTITTQPANQRVTAGQTATFTVVAAGTAPLSYQWQKNGVNVTGATSASYTTPATTTSDSGSTFAVVVSNTAGTVTSATATLTVNATPSAIAYVSASGTNCSQATASAGVACTLSASTVAGNDVIVGLSWQTTTVSINKVVGSASGSSFVIYAQQTNSTSEASAILVCLNCAALTSVTPMFSGTTLYELNVAEYSGVSWMGITGINGGTSTSPGLAFMTGDSNDFVVVETSSLGNAGIPTANTGNLREANRTGTTSANVAGALIDNTVASAGSVTADATITSGAWAAAGVELRTTAPKTYIWPDCDSTHPCLIYHYGRPAMPLEKDGPLFKFWVRPSLASNLLVLTITHPGTISSIVDAKSNTWASGPSAASYYTTDVRYVCGAAAGSGGEIDITLNAAIGVSDIMQVDYDEFSGVATSSCSDGTSSAINLSAGAMNPGSITTTQAGDLIYTFGIDASGNQTNGFPSGREMPDDSSANIWDSMFENFISTISVQASSGAINPTLYVSGMDIGQQSTEWDLVAQTFKASSGAGTQPPSGKAWVIRDVVSWNSSAVTLAYFAGPTNGNAIVFDTTNYQDILDLRTLKDNQGGTYTVNPITDTGGDPEQYTNCLVTGGVNRDRTFSFTVSSNKTEHYLDIAGAKTSGGSTGCIGNKSAHNPGIQAAVSNANVVTSAFSTPFSFTPVLNGSAYSVVVVDVGFGTGPPSGPCNSGGVTPPTCTNDMTPFVFGSVWATNMGDGDHYTTGDAYGWYSTNSATATSFDFFMANSVGQPGGGTGVQAAALEILGQPAAAAGDVTGLN